MDGIILVDKPSDISSFGVVAKVRKRISLATGKKAKVGHAGTLDPFATGLLILMCGSATKRASEFLKLDKSYEATITLGKTSTTADPEGEIIGIGNRVPSRQEIDEVLLKFTGEIMQTPPVYSAIKVGGRRAYDMARKGQEVKLEPRRVDIYNLECTDYSYPELKIKVSVSSGTYIRSLAVDIGETLGIGGYLTSLRRTTIGKYRVEDAFELESISPESLRSQVVSIDNL